MQRSEFNFFLELPVRWGDMDAFGHVNNVQFLRYLESGRIAYLDNVQKRLMERPSTSGQSVILADVQCSFLQQLRYPAIVEVAVRTSRIGTSSFQLGCAIYREDQETAVATSRSVLVWFDFAEQRPHPLPMALREAITAFEASSLV